MERRKFRSFEERVHDRTEKLFFAIVVAGAALLYALAASKAEAAPVTINYEMPTTFCDGAPIPQIDQMEIYVSAGPIPASDVPCPTEGGTVDPAPENFSTRIEVEGAGSTTVDLFGGQTYYARARVRVGDNWSNLSNQVSIAVPVSPVRAPVILNITF